MTKRRSLQPRPDQAGVRAQYERFPYPTPEDDLGPWLRGERAGISFPSLSFHRYWPRAHYREDLDILVAGCGTSQAALYAAAHPAARVTGIDISSAALAATGTLVHRHGLGNLQLEQLPVEQARELGEQRFDLVVSSGVIHHLPDPGAGLRALHEVTRPGGSLYLMVYAPHGRDAIYYLQDLCRQLGIRPDTITDSDLDGLRAMLDALPACHPLWHRKALFPDLGQVAELVDYLLHPIDRPYTLESFEQALEGAGLRLQGLFFRAHYEPLATALATSPWAQAALAMPVPQRWYLGETYRASLFKHEVIACRQDRPVRDSQIGVDDDDWLEHVPVPAPGLRTQVPDPPPGKAGVVSWPFHSFADIRLPYDRQQAIWLNRINGRDPLGSILGNDPAHAAALREFVRDLEALDFVSLRGAGTGPR
ncbi:MAG TPA: class I SAM-dependent methyltransferase [Xanthomonadaceae bacterium]|nr:class I SAM-dependent methyltransferase [Xanthomonadaceae bacterium]